MFGFTLPENQEAFNQTGDKRYIQSLTRLVIQTGKEDTRAFFMTIVPDKDFLEEKNFMAFYSTYKKWQKGFNGCVIYHTMEGDFANGWVFEKGVVVKTLQLENGMNLDVNLKSGTYECTDYYTINWYQDCTDYYTMTEYSNNYTGTTCNEPYAEYMYIGSICNYTDSDDDDDDGYGGGGGGGYNPPGGQNASTPNTDKLYHSTSTLTASQKQKLESAMTAFITQYPVCTQLYEKLLDMEIKYKFSIDTGLDGLAAYDPANQNISFKHENYITEEKLTEELIHAIQYNGYYGSEMRPDIKNYEYEAKVFQDFACLETYYTCPQYGSMGQSDEFQSRYSKWILDVYQGQEGFIFEDKATFNGFCNEWDGYPGETKSNFTPKMLYDYFEGIL